MNQKILRKSKTVITLYVLAAINLAYALFTIASSISYVKSYAAAYGQSADFASTVAYVIPNAYQPVMFAVLLFVAAVVLNEVRALNPAYYATAEEIAAVKAAKAAKKEAAKAEEKAAVEALTEEVEAEDAEKTEVAVEAAEETAEAAEEK